MAVPKAKTSKARSRSRFANWKLNTVGLVECEHCHELKQSHRACPKCGYYDGKQAVVKKEKSDK